jgi:hypothetical protein
VEVVEPLRTKLLVTVVVALEFMAKEPMAPQQLRAQAAADLGADLDRLHRVAVVVHMVAVVVVLRKLACIQEMVLVRAAHYELFGVLAERIRRLTQGTFNV